MQRTFNTNKTLWVGIAFSFAFVVLIKVAGDLWLPPRDFAADNPDVMMWYLWQLREPSFWSRFTAWGFYAVHQLSIWYLIWRAQTGKLKYTNALHWENVAALAVNAFFICVHLLQSLVWYDGLAQDVPEWTSQASVALMLFVILMIENSRRGLVFGYKAPLGEDVTRMVRKYHGYYFSWAILYTFWYHPMETTLGHLAGFLYMFLLMLQGSLFFTRAHVNPRWTIWAEISVVGHAVMVAYVAGHMGWAMFLAGFTGVFLITQMHGLGFSRATRWVIGIACIAALAGLFAYIGDISLMQRIPLIPFIQYLGVLVIGLVLWLMLQLARLISK
ncbi:MAG: hypothetical protein OEU86_02405 [Gammaproteobacteria bacterium]|nr:hypothetical protein [Gammaproteobacteria bacterium]